MLKQKEQKERKGPLQKRGVSGFDLHNERNHDWTQEEIAEVIPGAAVGTRKNHGMLVGANY